MHWAVTLLQQQHPSRQQPTLAFRVRMTRRCVPCTEACRTAPNAGLPCMQGRDGASDGTAILMKRRHAWHQLSRSEKNGCCSRRSQLTPQSADSMQSFLQHAHSLSPSRWTQARCSSKGVPQRWRA
jgi:hypothetical protein